MSVSTRIDNDILIAQIDNPPVNALGAGVRQGLAAMLDALEANPALVGAVIAGSAKAFSGGADIREFGAPPVAPILPNLLERVERCAKPVVAAIDAMALGGGLETALACSGRVASPQASLGLPEVNLGLIPGAGGTQRLPRLVGIKAAAEMITSGKPVSAASALKIGLVDDIAQGDVVAAAAGFARMLAAAPKRREPGKAADDVDETWIAEFERRLARSARGQLSPLKALEAVKAVRDHSLEEGLRLERELFLECMASDQRAALSHGFFAEREAKKAPFLSDASPREVNEIAVIGAGTMGVGIAVAAAQSGYHVRIFDTAPEALASGLAKIEKILSREAEKGRLAPARAAQAIENVVAVSSFDAFAGADLIIEAIVENMDVKKKVFAALDAVAKPGAVLASNTSYLNINKIATAVKRPEDVIGMHFFSPANVMRLLEIVQTDKASPDALATAKAAALKMNKIPVFARVCDGFIGNRIFKRYRQQAEYLVEDGASLQDVDRVMRGFGFAMGPFEVSDLAGLDIGWANRRREDAKRDPRERYADAADALYEMGRLGQKTGSGWYRYEAGDRTPRVDPAVEELIAARAQAKGILRRAIGDQEIEDRLIICMVNEGAKLLGEGVARSAADIDLVFLHGYGFPKYRGGPMFYADRIGAAAILEKVRRFAELDPYAWTPAPLLVACTQESKSFSDMS